MQYKALFTATAAVASAAVLPRQDTPTWTVTNFSGRSSPDGPFTWSMDVSNGTFSSSCETSMNVHGSECGAAAEPFAFNQIVCADVSLWGWQLTETETVTQPPQPAYALRVSFSPPGAETMYGCGPMLTRNVTCVDASSDPNQEMAVFNAPSSFEVSTLSMGSECVYA